MNDEKQQIQEDEYWFPYHYISQYKPAFSQTFNDTWGINYVATIEFLLDQISLLDFESIIDIGCGDGRFTSELQAKYPEKHIVGIDYSPRAIMLAKAMNPKGNYKCVDITNWESDNQFDIAVLMEVFEHVPPECGSEFMHGVAKCLKNDGILLLTVPHSNKPIEYKHYRHFDAISISECIMPYFEVLEIVPFEKICFRKKVLDALLTNRLFILNHQSLRRRLYSVYKEKLFFVSTEKYCKRLFVKAKRKVGY